MIRILVILHVISLFAVNQMAIAGNARIDSTIAVWLFDEHQNLYPRSVLNEVGPN
jgi:hypothetical protein